jgi:RNA polymerase sigma-70 factor (ECF subfamily)
VSSLPWWTDIHKRLIGHDNVAPAQLAEVALPLLEGHLHASYPKVRDAEMIADAAVDAVVAYVKDPAKFDPSKRSLLGYLKMAAVGDLLNRIAKEGRRRDRAKGEGDRVELDQLAGKESVGAVDETESPAQTIDTLFPSERDRRMASLVIEGERSTAKFAAVLGITGRSIEDQRIIVKKHKDRIKKVLQRRGREHRG